MYVYIYMCALPSRFIKECNEVSTASMSIGACGMADSKMADCGGDQRKSRQDRKSNQRQSASASEGIINKVKGDDADRRLANLTTAT